MNRFTLAAVASTLAAAATVAHAANGSAVNWGKLVGLNTVNARLCGATPEQVAAYKARQLQVGKSVYGQASGDFDADFETGFSQGLAQMEQAQQRGAPRPDPDTCQQLLQDAR